MKPKSKLTTVLVLVLMAQNAAAMCAAPSMIFLGRTIEFLQSGCGLLLYFATFFTMFAVGTVRIMRKKQMSLTKKGVIALIIYSVFIAVALPVSITALGYIAYEVISSIYLPWRFNGMLFIGTTILGSILANYLIITYSYLYFVRRAFGIDKKAAKNSAIILGIVGNLALVLVIAYYFTRNFCESIYRCRDSFACEVIDGEKVCW